MYVRCIKKLLRTTCYRNCTFVLVIDCKQIVWGENESSWTPNR
jgi:hypothetical protein